METLTIFLKYEFFVILGAFMIVMLYQMFTGRINTERLLYDKKTKRLSPGRVQQLFFALFTALYVVVLTYKSPNAFPEIPDTLMYLMGGSSIMYLAGKTQSLFNIFKKVL